MVGKSYFDVGHDLETAPIGQKQVEKNDVGPRCRDACIADFPSRSHRDPIAVVLELHLVHLSDRRVVFDQQNVNLLAPTAVAAGEEARPEHRPKTAFA